MNQTEIGKIPEILEYIENNVSCANTIVFRGEKRDYKETSLVPFVYRNGYIHKEDSIFRESRRYNDEFFREDNTTFDHLSRIQHYSAPTRLIDVSEDLFSALYFAIFEKKETCTEDAILYIFEIDKSKTRYFDSDCVSVIANLAKIPLESDSEKSKKKIAEACRSIDDCCFNRKKSIEYLLHEIRNEKPQFNAGINKEHISSIQFVLPKLTSHRLKSQKGAFLIFGIDISDPSKPLRILNDSGNLEPAIDGGKFNHPILKLHKLILKNDAVGKIKGELKKMGIKKSFIYPEIDKVSEYLKEEYQHKEN